ncbi:MAG: DNA-directed RNA polymerase subunit alpha [Planctomycetota bacterium]
MRAKWKEFEMPTRVVQDHTVSSDKYGKFYIEPFEKGFGHTIGNSLRRILLSYIKGSAPYYMKIRGVQHEFSTIDNVVEDVLEIALNVKRLVVKLEQDEPKKLFLEVHKKGPVKAAQIQPDPTVTIINPELVIATLAEDIDFYMEIGVRPGRGYKTAKEHLLDGTVNKEVGIIPLDSIFTPITRVAYTVEDARVGLSSNYDKLVLEIWTNGLITPQLALTQAARILQKHLVPFIFYQELSQEVSVSEIIETTTKKKKELFDELKNLLLRPVTEFDFSIRALHCFESINVKTLADLVSKTEKELQEVKNLGRATLKEIKTKLSELGLSLCMDVDSILNETAEIESIKEIIKKDKNT